MRLRTVAAAIVLCTSLAQTGTAHAVVLGRIQVQSGVGEPLRAEIDIADITPTEFANLRVKLGSSEAFRAAGLTYNPALTQAQVSLEQRADGKQFLRLTTAEAVTEPFMDLVVEAQWSAGRTVRSYTLLLNPPRQASDTVSSTTSTATLTPQLRETARSETQTPRPAIRTRGVEQNAADTGEPQSIQVKPGDTAGRIAARFRPASVSLDQMLLAMFRNNPQAFLGNNMNRIKAGALIQLPEETLAQAIDPTEARQIIAAQSKDFNEFRRRLADQAPRTSASDANGANGQSSTGRVQAEVQDQRASNPASDVLTLSKASVAQAEEEKIARDQQAKETAAREAELSRNLEDLAKVQAAASSAQGAENGSSKQTGGVTAPAATNGSGKVSSLVASLIESPLVLPAAGGLLALLGLTGYLVSRRRREKRAFDSSLTNSQPGSEPFMMADRDNLVDGSALSATTSTLPLNPDGPNAGDVDPVAEADVYLAYGRDLQAEEILKEALSRDPKRMAIHLKLLSIYAKRRDLESFDALMMDAHALTKGTGAEWAHICDMARELDANAPLYSPPSFLGDSDTTSAPTQETAPKDDNDPSPRNQPVVQPTHLASILEKDNAPSHNSAKTTATDVSGGVQTAAFSPSSGRARMTVNPFNQRSFVGITPAQVPRKDSLANRQASPGPGVGTVATDNHGEGKPSTQTGSDFDEGPQVDWDALNLDIDVESPSGQPSKKI